MDKLIETEEVLKMLGLKNKSGLSLPPYKNAIRPKERGLYSYKEVLKYLEDKDARTKFMFMVQSLVLFMLDEVENKTEFGRYLGYSQLSNLDAFLKSRIANERTAIVFVKCCRYRKSLVYKYDKYMGYIK